MTRGKIMRDTNAGPGIVYVDGVQKTFTLETHWKSSSPPKVGAVVEVTLDSAGNPVALELVQEADLAKEQAQKALQFASENGKQYAAVVLAKVGAPTLIAMALLAVGWIFLATLSIRVSSAYSSSMTFYDVLKLANAGGNLDALGSMSYGSTGIYGFLMWTALLAPLATHFHPNKFATLGYCAPLAFMLFVGLSLYFSIRGRVAEAQQLTQGMFGSQMGKMMESMASEMFTATLKAFSLGLGLYLSAAVAVYLAFVGVKKYLAAIAASSPVTTATA